ncbi:MAG: hypothetical protein QW776_04840 [Candidatus Nitrosocaldus sp.]
MGSMRDMIRVGAIVILVLISLVSIPSIINGSYGSNNSSSRNSTNNMVDLLYIWTVPSQIIVGDEFRIKAIVVNNSSSNHVITYKGLCESPLSVEFDEHVSIESVPACLGFTVHELNTGESIEVTGPSSGIVYRAVSAGSVRATVTFTYFIDDRMESISKELVFKIDEGTSVMFDEQFTLPIGQSARIIEDDIDSILVRFVDILEDSRCPIDAYCIRAGSATVMLELTSAYGSMYLDLAIGDKGHSVARVMDYTVILLDVHPYPVIGREIDKDDYTITLLVSKSVPIEHGAVRAYSYDDGRKMIIVWNEQSMKGFMISESKVIHFKVEHKKCTGIDDICFNAITEWDTTAISIDYNDDMRMLVDDRYFSVKRMFILFDDLRVEYTLTPLGIGAGDGPVMVTDIREDGSVVTINYQEYPTEASRPVILESGDSISNGCTITFKLVGIKGLLIAKQEGGAEGPLAIFIKEVVNKGKCNMYSTTLLN